VETVDNFLVCKEAYLPPRIVDYLGVKFSERKDGPLKIDKGNCNFLKVFLKEVH